MLDECFIKADILSDQWTPSCVLFLVVIFLNKHYVLPLVQVRHCLQLHTL